MGCVVLRVGVVEGAFVVSVGDRRWPRRRTGRRIEEWRIAERGTKVSIAFGQTSTSYANKERRCRYAK
jgi:hypothetical protein